MRKARLLYLVDKYENELISSTGKRKEDYIGKIGKVIHTCIISKDHYVKHILYDVQFDDGARFCVEREQIEFVEDVE